MVWKTEREQSKEVHGFERLKDDDLKRCMAWKTEREQKLENRWVETTKVSERMDIKKENHRQGLVMKDRKLQ